MREIGSDFWDIPTGNKNNLFPDDTQWFVSGRSALQAIIAENHFKTVSLPFWCCDSMIKPFVNVGIEVFFYNKEPTIADAILVMDYFGYSMGEDYKNYPGIVIRDVTHSLLSKSYDDADYLFGSLRKWAGFWTGGFVCGLKAKNTYPKCNLDYAHLRKKAMKMKMEYISGNILSKDYLLFFEEAEKILENIGIENGLERDIEYASLFDVKGVIKQRRKNAKIIMEAFPKLLIFPKLLDSDCPLFVPIHVENRDGLRRYLIENEVYCPVHWPISSYHILSCEKKQFYSTELSIVCDQRYSENDMRRIVSLIREYELDGEIN